MKLLLDMYIFKKLIERRRQRRSPTLDSIVRDLLMSCLLASAVLTACLIYLAIRIAIL